MDKTKTAVVMEMKSLVRFGKRRESYKKALSEALAQIEQKGYARELAAEGYTDILKLAVVSDGKKVWVKMIE